jgi:pyruvate/2-oxoglutarate dehydrogenase complex dihydrolipoamide acyltransferase (E2) component
MMKTSLLLSCVVIAASSAAFAQAPPAPATPPAQTAAPAPARADNCAPTESTPQGNIAPQGTTTGQRAEPLGDKLARSDGVLCPPAGVDPQMRAPTPDTGNTPVIPPPGSPGGDPTIRPK